MKERNTNDPWRSLPVEHLARDIDVSAAGLSSSEAAARLQRFGANTLKGKDASRVASLLLRQISSPIVLILIVAGILSFVMRDATDGVIILIIVIAGETFPVEKMAGDLPTDTPLARLTNALFQGTHVVSGIGRALVLRTGRDTLSSLVLWA